MKRDRLFPKSALDRLRPRATVFRDRKREADKLAARQPMLWACDTCCDGGEAPDGAACPDC